MRWNNSKRLPILNEMHLWGSSHPATFKRALWEFIGFLEVDGFFMAPMYFVFVFLADFWQYCYALLETTRRVWTYWTRGLKNVLPHFLCYLISIYFPWYLIGFNETCWSGISALSSVFAPSYIKSYWSCWDRVFPDMLHAVSINESYASFIFSSTWGCCSCKQVL